MNHTRTALAVAALALSAAAVGATNAAATHPAENGTLPVTVVPHDPPPTATIEVPVDDITSEALQAGASALGGASIALGAVWIYRRRQPRNG
jgi:hypothetical protein